MVLWPELRWAARSAQLSAAWWVRRRPLRARRLAAIAIAATTATGTATFTIIGAEPNASVLADVASAW